MTSEKLDFDSYQAFCKTTAVYPSIRHPIIYPSLGLAGEAGEFCEKVKKIFRDSNGEISPETRILLGKELGDVLWYCSALSTELGFTLSEIAQMNIEKLSSRKSREKIHGSGDIR